MSKSTGSKRPRKSATKPEKPYPAFPLTSHAGGKWMKKIRGKIHYFGRWGQIVDGVMVRLDGDGANEALELYKKQADDLHAGRTPRTTGNTPTVRDLCNAFHVAKKRQLESGEIAQRTFNEYEATTDRLVEAFGKNRFVEDLKPSDFEELRAEIAKTWGPHRLGGEVQRIRTVFKYGTETGLLVKAVLFGPMFKKPSKTVLRRHRAASGERMFEAAEIHALLAAASPVTKAMILLAVNCAFGNFDLASLPLSAVDLDEAVIEFPRPKTGIPRRCPLWPETVEALTVAIAARPSPKMESAKGLVFVSPRGRPYKGEGSGNPLAVMFGALRKSAGVAHRAGTGLYALRHVFRTIADATKDTVAIDRIMGHVDTSMADPYRERIDDSRLVAVSEHVRQWLYAAAPPAGDDDVPEKLKVYRSRTTKPQESADSDLPRLRVVG